MAVVQHQNLIRVLQAGGALAHDEHGQAAGQSSQCLAQSSIGGVVQCAGAVVKDQNLRLAHKGAGDGQALLLSAGQVATALLHRLVQPKGLGFDELCSLCCFQCGPQVRIGGILVAPQQVGADGAAKELGLLHDHGCLAAQFFTGIVPGIAAHDLHRALGGIVEAGNQVDKAGFAAAGTADDTNGLAALCSEADVGKAGCTGTRIGQAYMLKAHGIAGFFGGHLAQKLFREGHAGRGVQHSLHAACAGRVQAVLDTTPGMAFPEKLLGEVPAEKSGDAVRFEHVSLTYAGAGAPSLSDISFTAKRGQTIGVIGGTGSGKSSLVNLIPRFYDATEGTVEIMGRDARNYPREELRGKAAMVMQKAQLFGGTIRSNLLWGNKNATDADLWAALETAQAAEFVKAKPLGLDEPVEQGGRNLSGGQKQRLTIARALVGKPQILILDDSASALDYATDAALRKALAALPGSLTVFIVSQRAASLQHADQILVLDDGHLVGIGTHDQLRQTCPVYEEIYESQFKKGDAQK